MECLLHRKINRENLFIVKKILMSFVKEAQDIYPNDIMVSGMHEILHLVECLKTHWRNA
jgi:ribosomal protein L10